jgi:hypothetical protein
MAPDNSVNMSPDEQKYFDTQGAEAPAAPAAEQPSVPETKGPVAKKTTTKAKSTPAAAEPAEAPEDAQEGDVPAEQPVKKSAEQEQIDNLNAALREERQARKDIETRTTQRLQQLQDALIARQQPEQPKQQPQEMPDPEKDPMGALKHLLAKARETDQVQAVTVQETQRRQQEQRIMGEASRMEMEYLSTMPDYDATTRASATYNEASAFLVNMRRAELAAIGSYNPVQINQMVASEAIGLAAQALQGNRNPAQVVMEVAKARGFTPKPKGQAQPPAAAETETERLARIAKGQEAGFSLGQGSGSRAPVKNGFDAKTIANMSEDDFTAFLEKAKKSDLRGLMGD